MIPPDHNAEFVAAMEDVLEVYHRPHDPKRPVVCLDDLVVNHNPTSYLCRCCQR